MRYRHVLLPLFLFVAMPVAHSPAFAETPKLETLFGNLKKEDNARKAEEIARQIQREWTDSGSATVNLLMERSAAAMKAKKLSLALDLLDQVVMLAPGYVEGWNRRATVHFLNKSYGKSMADIERTLELEPRHFGALAGMATILRATGKDQLALQAYERVLSVYPMMRSAQKELGKLADKLAGEKI